MALSSLTKLARKTVPVRKCGAVIVAAGSAERMKGVDKMMAEIAGKPVLYHTVKAFEEAEVISEVVVVVRQDQIIAVTNQCKDFKKVLAVVAGGKTRQESVKNGLTVLSKDVKLAAIQDGARPLVSQSLIDRAVRAGHSFGAAIPAIPVKDTIKETKSGVVSGTPDRKLLFAAQTPQVFDIDLLRGAIKKAEQDELAVTDDASMIENMGMTVKVVEGDERNIKITTPIDLKIAALFMEEQG